MSSLPKWGDNSTYLSMPSSTSMEIHIWKWTHTTTSIHEFVTDGSSSRSNIRTWATQWQHYISTLSPLQNLRRPHPKKLGHHDINKKRSLQPLLMAIQDEQMVHTTRPLIMIMTQWTKFISRSTHITSTASTKTNRKVIHTTRWSSIPRQSDFRDSNRRET